MFLRLGADCICVVSKEMPNIIEANSKRNVISY